MLFYLDKSFLICIICLSTSFSDSSATVRFRRNTKLYFRREVAVIPDSVVSFTECAMKCVCKIKCVSFFYNHFDSLCQLGGKIYVSFADSSTDPWIYYEMDLKNVAALKTVALSSEHNPPSHSPQYATDDHVNNSIDGKYCSHTLGEVTPWLTIDLENTFYVHYVTLVNRIDAEGQRLRNISVYLGDDQIGGSFPAVCGRYAGPGENAEVVHIVCDKPAKGRFVRIQLNNNNFPVYHALTLCEVRVLV